MTPADSRGGVDPPSLLGAALAGADRGWPAFPLVEGAKVPKIPSAHPVGAPLRGKCKGECGRHGHGLYDASTDAGQLVEWWERWPRANVGWRTGIDFDALDIDVKDGAPGLGTLARILDEHGCLPPAPSVSTPSGGLHFYFRPTGHGNAAGFAPGLDWRGAGGYVVAPPSTVGGKRYEWGVGPSVGLPAAPAWLVSLLRPARTPPPPRGPIVRRSSSAYARRALEGELGRLAMAAVGERNHQLNRSAFALGQLVAAGALGAREVVEPLAAVAERIGLGAVEAEASIRSGLGAGMAQPRNVPA